MGCLESTRNDIRHIDLRREDEIAGTGIQEDVHQLKSGIANFDIAQQSVSCYKLDVCGIVSSIAVRM